MTNLGDALQVHQPPTVQVDLQELSDRFSQACQDKHTLGEQKYGPGTWVGVDTLAMMQDEIVDMANYARFSWIRLEIIRQMMDASGEVAEPLPGTEMLGKEGFFPTGGRS